MLDQFTYDVSRLLTPISAESPSGESLRYEGIYDRIREARREDDPTLDQGVWQSTLKQAEWPAMEELCLTALQHRTKDLQIAAWLLEAWLHLHGFAGVREGLRAIVALCQNFWEDIHPRLEGKDVEFRVAPFYWINEKLAVQLKLMQITQPETEDAPACSWADWEIACRPEPSRPSAEGSAFARRQRITQDQFRHSVMLTPNAFYELLVELLSESLASAGQLETLLDQLCGQDASSLRQFIGALETIQNMVATFLSQRDLAPEMLAAVQPEVEEPAPVPAGATPPIRDRTEAYRRLAEAADYLMRTEPHSPAPYLVRRAITWGSMRLDALLPELIRNNEELGEVYRLLHMRDDKKR